MQHVTAPLFGRYANAIATLPPGELRVDQLRCETFLLQREGEVEVFYTPFDHVNQSARVALVGITPGWHQMRLAHMAARDLLQEGRSQRQVLTATSNIAGFSGRMRSNLVRMLDELGLQANLGIDASCQLFAEHAELRHSTSAIRYAAFVSGINYTGSRPPLVTVPLFKRYVREVLGPELDSVVHAIVIPLGRAVESALGLLIQAGKLDPRRCCLGFPHPSSANAHRLRQLAAAEASLRATLTRWFSNA